MESITETIKVPRWFDNWAREWGYPEETASLIYDLAFANNCNQYHEYARMSYLELRRDGYDDEEIQRFADVGVVFAPSEWKYIRENFEKLVTVILFKNGEVK